LIDAHHGPSLDEVRKLFLEYAASLGFSLCFQGFDQELAALPGGYAPPRGRLWLLLVDGQPAGCVGLRPQSGGAAEMKRLYVRPAFRGAQLGRALAEAVVQAARELGYERLRLDTVPGMERAQAVYRSLGFRDIPPYTSNPIEGARYLELVLR
jgi:GNAT superfamily N-acetyltransferase